MAKIDNLRVCFYACVLGCVCVCVGARARVCVWACVDSLRVCFYACVRGSVAWSLVSTTERLHLIDRLWASVVLRLDIRSPQEMEEED